MGPYSEIACSGYRWLPDKGSILKAHGLDLSSPGQSPSVTPVSPHGGAPPIRIVLHALLNPSRPNSRALEKPRRKAPCCSKPPENRRSAAKELRNVCVSLRLSSS